MKTIKPIIAPFMAMILAMFWLAIPAQASTLNFGGFHDDGTLSDGYHYFELYWYSSDSNVQCSPSSGSDGYIQVYYDYAELNNGSGWVLDTLGDVSVTYQGQSGFSQHECQVNVKALPGTGDRKIFIDWYLNGTLQSSTPSYAVIF